MVCQNCFKSGHNRLTCKEGPSSKLLTTNININIDNNINDKTSIDSNKNEEKKRKDAERKRIERKMPAT